MTSQPAGPGVARPLGAAPSIGSRQLWWIGGVGITTALALLALFALARLPDLPMLNRAPTRTAPALAAGAQRLLSLNVTSDEIVLALAPDRVIGVSELALDPRSSNVVTEAAAVPLKVRGEIEQVLTAQPDVVVMGAHSADLARQVEEAGIRVVWIHGYQSIEWVRSVIRTIGVEMGLSERADRLVEQMDTRIEAVRRRVVSRQRPSVLAYSESGYVPGKDTTTDEVITLAGGDNIAARLGIAGWRKLSLEQVVIADPEVILLKEGAQWENGFHRALLGHPALQNSTAIRTGRVITLPSRLMVTSSHHIATTVEELARKLHPEAFEAGASRGAWDLVGLRLHHWS